MISVPHRALGGLWSAVVDEGGRRAAGDLGVLLPARRAQLAREVGLALPETGQTAIFAPCQCIVTIWAVHITMTALGERALRVASVVERVSDAFGVVQ